MKKAFAAMGNLSKEKSEDGGFKNRPLLAIEKTNKYDFLALVVITEPDEERKTHQSQETMQALMAGIGSDEYEEKEKQPENQLMDEYVSLRLDCMTLEDQITSRDNTINGLKELVKNPELSHKGKNHASELQFALEEDIKRLTINCQALTERNRLQQENLVMTKLDLERNLRWTRSSEFLTQLQERQTTSRTGIGFRK
ncbi:hypothetical protein KY289_008570 [Solanum tuberosum]|nr:hypothetical protein KY289_008570 [Solanum tuberosum]